MSSDPRYQPPPRWRALLTRVLPARDRTMLLEEMDVLYSGRAANEGEEAARRWYRSEVLHFVRRWPVEGLGASVANLAAEGKNVFSLTRQTVRSLMRSPGFTAISAITLGLGIGATAVIVGIADRALLRELPYPEADELVVVLDGWGTSLGSISILQEQMQTVEVIGGAQNAAGMTLEHPDAPAERVTVASVSPEYLEALRVTPTLGRTFSANESRPGEGQVLLLGHPFWTSHFGADPDAVGRTLVLDGDSYAIIGVLPEGFDMPSPRNDVWRPAVVDPSVPGLLWGAGNFSVVARMNPGVTPDRVRQEVLQVQEPVRLANPLWTPNPDFWNEAQVTALRDSRAQWVKAPLLILLGAVGMVLLVVCANVASLFVSRGLARSRDHAVRSALGAGSGRLAREQLFEVLVLSSGGLLLGVLLGLGGLAAIGPFLPAELPGIEDVGLDARILAITTGIALLTAIAAGALPAVRVSRSSPAQVLREAGRGQSGSRARRQTTRWLVSAQLAAAVVLVTSAGLLARTLMELNRVDPGFDPTDRVSAQVHLPPGLPNDAAARALYYEELATRIEAEPGVGSLALASTIPFGTEDELVAMVIDGVTTDPNDLPVVPHHRVSPNYFEVTGIPLTRGRAFVPGDRMDAPQVAIVDETFVSRFLTDREPIGQMIRYPWRGATPIEIVGVVGATQQGDLSGDPEPTVWVPLSQMTMGVLGHAVVVGTTQGDVDAGLLAITAGTRAFDNRVAVSDLASYPELLAGSLADTRLLAILLLVFATTTLVLGCIGVYGVAAFSVRQRTKEIGVRMAIGAPIGEIRRRILREGLMLAVPGGLLGLLLAVPVARALEGFLYGIAALDPLTLGTAPAVLGLAALLAVYIPAQRATQVDPATVLRDD